MGRKQRTRASRVLSEALQSEHLCSPAYLARLRREAAKAELPSLRAEVQRAEDEVKAARIRVARHVRESGGSWADVGLALGISDTTAHRLYRSYVG